MWLQKHFDWGIARLGGALAVTFALVLACGCGPSEHTQKPPQPPPKTQGLVMDISVHNSTSNDLNWVELDCGERNLSFGVVAAGKSAVVMKASWKPVATALVTITDSQKQAHKLQVSLTNLNEKLEAGDYRQITFRVLSNDKVEALLEE